MYCNQSIQSFSSRTGRENIPIKPSNGDMMASPPTLYFLSLSIIICPKFFFFYRGNFWKYSVKVIKKSVCRSWVRFSNYCKKKCWTIKLLEYCYLLIRIHCECIKLQKLHGLKTKINTCMSFYVLIVGDQR